MVNRYHRTVPEHTARSPIARLYAWQMLLEWATTAQLKLYGEGEAAPDQNHLIQIAEFLTICHLAIMHDKRQNHPNLVEPMSVISKAVALLAKCSEEGFVWQKEYVAPVVQALYDAQEIIKLATPDGIRVGWLAVHKPSLVVKKVHRKKKRK